MTEHGDVRITQREIYDKVTGLEDGLGRVEALLEKHVALEEQRNEGVEVRLENHGTRLSDQGTQITSLDGRVTQLEGDHRSLKEGLDKRETRRATWPQVVSALVALVAGAATLVGLFITLSKLAEVLGQMP